MLFMSCAWKIFRTEFRAEQKKNNTIIVVKTIASPASSVPNLEIYQFREEARPPVLATAGKLVYLTEGGSS